MYICFALEHEYIDLINSNAYNLFHKLVEKFTIAILTIIKFKKMSDRILKQKNLLPLPQKIKNYKIKYKLKIIISNTYRILNLF